MNVAVTGPRGFLGRDIVRTLRAAGHTVIELVRQPRPSNDPAAGERRYDLAEAPLPALLDDVDAIVHCAFARAKSPDADADAYRANVDGTMALFDLARERDVPFLFLSSLSAIPEARSVYGRQKLELERRLSAIGACILRPGLVVGAGGLVRNLVATMRARRIVPLVDGGTQPVQCIWLADVSEIVRALVERGCPPQTMTVAVEPPLTAGALARDLRRALGIRAASVSIPYPIAYGVAWLLEAAGLPSPLPVESLLGLRASRVQAVDDARPLGVSLMPWTGQCAALATELSAVRPRR